MDQELPPHIQRQVEEAEAIEAAIAAEQATLNTPENTDPPEVIAEPVAEPVPEPVLKALPDADEETWHSRFTTLQGKFQAEVPRLHQQLKESNQSLAEMRSQIDQIRQQPVEPVQEAQTVTTEDEEAFGSDLIAVMKKVAKQEAAAVAKQQEAHTQSINRKVDSVMQDQANTAGDKFMASIATAIPEWETINADPKWLDWLGEYSPETGAPRQDSLDSASNNLDSKRAIALFNLFKSQNPVAPVSTQTKAQQELQRQVAPAKTAASTGQTITEKIWTGDEYEQAFDVRLNHTHSDAEIAEIQVEAERAYNDGRIRW